ncbi:SGNH/GDSL hydrolase family protein [Mucilaginibacter boryungensis]|uniref:SGNH/GDSL hydrolase family protein n=1 Tax=Mucilaginibacter boryungensis TaxID=768480 RepID=A0ABR9XBR8_9SPHI|nr:SGNH/GDSL hydrolase family protein [Mucilaginibacter boryungensis]MBE9664782.1 SGNH/GDSL hydrolase family protein [Mucilaginibacter boryungensis]
MKGLILTIIGISSLLACSKSVISLPDAPDTNVQIMPVSNTPITYLALGDSYTIGEAVSQKDSFPFQLVDKLINYGVQNPTVIAQTGWTADNLIAAINSSGINGQTYDIVTLLIGVNDQYQGLSQTNYRTKFVQLVNMAITFAKGNKKRVFVVSIPDWGVTPYASSREATIGPEIDQFNAINKAESDKAGVNYINITLISKQAATDNTLIAADGLHPSPAMYAQWVLAIAPVVTSQLK